MTDRIETVIDEWMDAHGMDDMGLEARDLLDRFKAARIAVVELPEPVVSPRHQERIWEVGDSHVIFNEKWGDIRAELDYDNGDDDPLSTSDAGAFAAALLAAKAAAEASQ